MSFLSLDKRKVPRTPPIKVPMMQGKKTLKSKPPFKM